VGNIFKNPSPLARLVAIMILLSAAGAFVAGVHYFTGDLSLQNTVTTPQDGYDPDVMYDCQTAWAGCMNSCGRVDTPKNGDCESRCNDQLEICVNG
jgi:hypothetical protein